MAHLTASQGGGAAQGGGMSGSVRVARLLGLDIYLHWSWTLIFLLVTWTLSGSYLPEVYPESPEEAYWFVGTATALLFFASVLAHELSHAIVARRRGLTVSGITLFIFGGVSSLTEEPRRPNDEFWMALVGPLTSFAVGGFFALLWLVGRALDLEPLQATAGYLAAINVALGVFNLLPGFPLDGGRLLRATVWRANHDLLRATRTAASAGRIVAVGLVLLGALSIASSGTLDGIWFMFIGWFLWNASGAGYQQMLLETNLRGVSVAQVMEAEAPAIRPELTLRQVASEGVLGRYQRAFLVTDADGALLGLISLPDLARIPAARWDTTSVRDAMTPRERLVTVTPDTDARTALKLLAEHDINQLPVLDGGQVAGILTRARVLRAIDLRAAVAELRRS